MLKHPYELNCLRVIGHKTKLIPFLTSFSPSLVFQLVFPHPSLQSKRNIFPQTCSLLHIIVLVLKTRQFRVLCCMISLKEGILVSDCCVLKKLSILAQSMELECMHLHIMRVGLKSFKLSKMASIISCYLFLPRISPRPII